MWQKKFGPTPAKAVLGSYVTALAYLALHSNALPVECRPSDSDLLFDAIWLGLVIVTSYIFGQARSETQRASKKDT
jgi:hypothetical protein